ncbi:MAG: glycosyltransferase family 2 protein [Acidimicrobiia bacterium]
MSVLAVVVWLAVPVVLVLFDIAPALRAGTKRVADIDRFTPVEDDFEVLVPIYGHIRFLENVEYLSHYGSKVVLCTTTAETAEFDSDIDAIALANGFRVVRVEVPGRSPNGAQRSTTAPVRDRLIRDALLTVAATYVVCIDADTTTSDDLGRLVGSLKHHDFDVASVRLVPSNTTTLLGRLQAHEYRLAMRMRRLYPWLVSGACHVARTAVHRDVMAHHSLFFQGNDVELGLLADAMGFRVGHIVFEVPTTVPERVKPWWRQRVAWAGGEFRLYIVNLRLGRRHPFFFGYGALVVFAGFPLRYLTLLAHPPVLAGVFATYVVAHYALGWANRDRVLLLLPLYTLFSTLVLVPLAPYAYWRMARAHHNYGLIRRRVPRRSMRQPGDVELEGYVVPAASILRSALKVNPPQSNWFGSLYFPKIDI